MSGLDKMKARILEEANHSAQESISEAEKEAEKIMQTAREEASAGADTILAKAKRDAAEQEKRNASSRDMKKKQAVLAAKQEVIRSVIDRAYESVRKMDAQEYFELLEKALEKYVLPQEGEICFSGADLERMPGDFPEKIQKAAADKGGKLTVSREAADIDGGFLLRYGGIEENCTIKALFGSKREELSDKVNRMLFG